MSAHPEKEEIRIWSAGCSTGEEAYSVAILVSDQLALDATAAKMQVFATDIDERAIAVGRGGLYPGAIITDVPPPRLRQYFIKEDQHFGCARRSAKRCCSPSTACYRTHRSRRST